MQGHANPGLEDVCTCSFHACPTSFIIVAISLAHGADIAPFAICWFTTEGFLLNIPLVFYLSDEANGTCFSSALFEVPISTRSFPFSDAI